MSKRRTKKDLIKAAQRRQRRLVKKQRSIAKNSTDDSSNLIHYNTQLITQDLKKTLIATLIVFTALVALYFQL